MMQLEEFLVYVEHIDKQRRDEMLTNKVHKNHVKSQYYKFVHPRVFSGGDLVLAYEQDKDSLWAGKFNSMWHSPYIMQHVLAKGLTSYHIIREMCFQSPEMGSTLRSTMLDPDVSSTSSFVIIVYCCI
jgi:hypothetical protein